MTKAEIAAALQAAFTECDSAGFPLDERQKQILLHITEVLIQDSLSSSTEAATETANPLDDLTPEQRQSFLEFVAESNELNDSWKTRLLNDWLLGRDSGSVQFIRDQYGLQWLDSIKPTHLAAYEEAKTLKVKIGDRLEVSNSLWEWVPEPSSCDREWFPCTVIRVFESSDNGYSYINCTVRLENGLEYDVNGMYDWNHHNWRWPKA
jgi:hypothetical protein